MSRVKKVIQQLYWLITFVGFNGGQSYLATLVTPQNCTKMVRNLTLLYNLYILASDQTTFLTKSNFLATLWQIPGSFLKNLEQFVESPSLDTYFWIFLNRLKSDFILVRSPQNFHHYLTLAWSLSKCNCKVKIDLTNDKQKSLKSVKDEFCDT